MALYKPSLLHSFLKENQIYPQKNLSQNFLIDKNIIDKLLKTASVKPEDLIIEIGPGPGSLTTALLKKKAKVLAIEKDTSFAKNLQKLKQENNNLIILEEDVLNVNLTSILEKELIPNQKVKIVSNLPFQITSAIFQKIFEISSYLDSVTVIVQKEVGKKITALCGASNYGMFSIFVQMFSKPKYVHTISANSFYPKPKISSAILHCEILKPIYFEKICRAMTLVKQAFQKKRKTLFNTLKNHYSITCLQNAFDLLKIDKLARPCDISFETYIKLHELLCLT